MDSKTSPDWKTVDAEMSELLAEVASTANKTLSSGARGALSKLDLASLDISEQILRAKCESFVAAVIAPLRTSDPRAAVEAYRNLGALISAAFLIGSHGVANDATKKFLQESLSTEQATKARQGNSKAAAARKQQLRPAIFEAAKGLELVGSHKFANSIGNKVRASAGVDSTARGFSDRAIQREIGAILEERRNS
jgi:hypothetical protein